MSSYSIKLADADEIGLFYQSTTGMAPEFRQLSAGPVDLRHDVVDLDGVTLVWSRVRGRTWWRDQMPEGALHLGFVVDSAGPVTVRGHAIGADEVQVWVPGEQMDYVMTGPVVTLEVGIEARLVEELGWCASGEPLRRVPADRLARLTRVCRVASGSTANDRAGRIRWRDLILDELEPLLEPWLRNPATDGLRLRREKPHYLLVKRADAFLSDLVYDEPLVVDHLAEALGVPRRTIFHAYRKLLGVGPRRYFELERLQVLRSRLKRASSSETTVGDIAMTLGFTNLGRLPALYRQQFGENPRETLDGTFDTRQRSR